MKGPTGPIDPAVLRGRLAAAVVGRRQELDAILAVLAAGRDLLLEGPPGTGKSTILRAITANWGVPFLFVEGNAELTPAKLVGHHSPARVLREDYNAENFVPGPLTEAVQRGGFLYIEEFNRVPEDTLNALLTAMAERELVVPRVGRIRALPGFRVVAAMNPFDNVGTSRISSSIYDRMCHLAVGYQSAVEETDIVALRTGSIDHHLIADAVALTRATRSHPEVRAGSSVRGAIDLVLVADRLAQLRGKPVPGEARAGQILDAALLALSGRIALAETSEFTPEQVIRELWEDHFYLNPNRAAPGPYAIDVDNAIRVGGNAPRRVAASRLQPLARKPKVLDEAPQLYRPSASGDWVLEGGGSRSRSTPGAAPVPAGFTGTTVTGEQGALERRESVLAAKQMDPEVLGEARRIARRLSVRRRPRDRVVGAGRGQIVSIPYRYNSDDIDIDRTIAVLMERPVPEDTDIIVRERMLTRRAIALIVDVSGSMKGEKTRIAAATVAALLGDLCDDEVAVVAFWKDAALLKKIDRWRSSERVLTDLLRIPPRGLTNITFGLEVGIGELVRSQARRRVGILLSDAVHNAGPDPRELVPRFEQLHVLLETDGEHDELLATDLARLGHGEVARIAHYSQVPAALNHMLGR